MTAKGGDQVERDDLGLTESLMFEIVEIVKKGNFRHVAAGMAGVSPNTLGSWVRRGKGHIKKGTPNSLQARLVKELEKAESIAHSGILKDVLEKGDPNVKLKFLQLRYNKLYSMNPNAHIDDETGEESTVSMAALLKEKLAALVGAE